MTTSPDPKLVIFLCGDVMTGRGIDQMLPHHGNPELRESAVSDARTYVALAERVSGSIPAPTDFKWPWGEALSVLDEFAPDIRLINLETTITAGGEFAPGKAVHYRMHPGNVGCLSAIRPDACALANNHILDFGPQGLADTVCALERAGICGTGAGLTADQAERPAVVAVGGGRRVVIASYGMQSSGIPRSWAATATRPGVAIVTELSDRSAAKIAERVADGKRPGDVTIVSLHWGSNWGHHIAQSQIRFARRLIDLGVDVVHGHSSHHPRPIEMYRGKPILYGCGDTVDDYEGITGYEAFRPELRLLYFVAIEPGGNIGLRMVPMRMRRMRLERVARADTEWLRSTMEHISRQFGIGVFDTPDGFLTVGVS